ncbi:MAG TPA: hypothetical protein VNN22_00070 [Verrucomicrobiae bacterium]|nr:hypothetical protein [Verrucomicrobiae bacterium]
MKLRWLFFLICVILGVTLLAGGLLVPAHLRALDAAVLQGAGRDGFTLLARGQSLADGKKLGAAQFVLQAARIGKIPDSEKFAATWTNLAAQNPDAQFWGDDSHVKHLFGSHFTAPDQTAPLTDFMVRQENRDAALAYLGGSRNGAAQALMRSRSFSKTVIFPPSRSAAGQAFDMAVSICGLMLDDGRLTGNLNDEILNLASQANQGNSSEPLERVLMDFTSLGGRFNWDQLTAFVAQIQTVKTLHQLAEEARGAGEQLPVLFAAVQLSGQPAGVADYLATFKETGWQDLGTSLGYGAGGVRELVQRQQRLYISNWERRVTAFDPFGRFVSSAAKLSVQTPWLALAAKFVSYMLAGFFLAAALHFARPEAPTLERPLQVRGFHLFRELLFSVGFLLVVLLLSEPFLAQEHQKGDFSLRLFPSMVGGAVPAGIAGIQQTIMNPIILLTLLVFFVLQFLIYISCLVKLAEIRRQNIPPGMKLKLLENEDHLFDAGLYLGFFGTIVSLIVASLGLVKFSLMAAYSSTSFGIIFVVIFKIFHLRPARRKLLLEAEAQNPPGERYAPAAEPATVMPS